MGRLTRKQRAERMWATFLSNNQEKDIEQLPESIKTFESLYGPLPLIVLLRLFQNIKRAWMLNTNVGYRNKLYNFTFQHFGRGFAEELQRISNKRTF